MKRTVHFKRRRAPEGVRFTTTRYEIKKPAPFRGRLFCVCGGGGRLTSGSTRRNRACGPLQTPAGPMRFGPAPPIHLRRTRLIPTLFLPNPASNGPSASSSLFPPTSRRSHRGAPPRVCDARSQVGRRKTIPAQPIERPRLFECRPPLGLPAVGCDAAGRGSSGRGDRGRSGERDSNPRARARGGPRIAGGRRADDPGQRSRAAVRRDPRSYLDRKRGGAILNAERAS